MKNKKGLCWIGGGIALLLAALSLVLFNWHQDKIGGNQAQEYLKALRSEIPEEFPASEEYSIAGEDLLGEYGIDTGTDVEPLTLDGQTFLGIITIPDLNIELPVLLEWSYPNLKTAPCRYDGSVQEGNLILAAHNYQTHFGRIQELNTGAILYFTECSGAVHTYEVVQTELIAGQDIVSMHNGSDEWDLTLFTCTLSGRNRVTVRAVETG